MHYRLVASAIVRGPVRIDAVNFPEMSVYCKPEERLVLVPLRDLEETAKLLRTAGHTVAIGLHDPELTAPNEVPKIDWVAPFEKP